MPESRRTLSGGGGCGMGGTAPPLLTSICISARRRFSSMGMLLMTSPALCVSCTKVATGDDHGTPQRVTCDRQPCVSRQRGAGHGGTLQGAIAHRAYLQCGEKVLHVLHKVLDVLEAETLPLHLKHRVLRRRHALRALRRPRVVARVATALLRRERRPHVLVQRSCWWLAVRVRATGRRTPRCVRSFTPQ